MPGFEQPLPGNWLRNSEDLGVATVRGFEAHGTRVVRRLVEDATVSAVDEQWYSTKLGIIVEATGHGPTGNYSAHIDHLDLQAPDRTLFEIPPGFKIQDLSR
jgi:hypothetical protein